VSYGGPTGGQPSSPYKRREPFPLTIEAAMNPFIPRLSLLLSGFGVSSYSAPQLTVLLMTGLDFITIEIVCQYTLGELKP
jgi:hypothetical protein